MGKAGLRMKKYKYLLVLAAVSAALLTGCAEQTKPAPEPIEIQIPEPCHYGFVMIRTPEGSQTMYSSSIDIQNDGKDGNAIYIVLDKGVIQQ